MNLGRRIISAAVRELGNACGRDGDLDEARQLLLQLPWSRDVDAEFVSDLVRAAASDARILPPDAVLARADLVLALAGGGLDEQRAAAAGALDVAVEAGAPERVVAYAELALSRRLADGASSRYLAECLELQGRGLAVLGRADEAAASFAAAAREAAEGGVGSVEAGALCELAAGHLQRGDALAAVEAATAAVNRAATGGHVAALARAYGLLGVAQLHLHRLGAADQALRDAVEAARRAEDRLAQTNWLGNLGIVAMQDGRWDDAIGYHLDALELSRAVGSVESELADLRNLTATLRGAGRAEEALERLAEAVRLAEGGGDAELVAHLRDRLRDAYQEAGHYAEALALDELLTSQPESPEGAEPPGAGDEEAEAFLAELSSLRSSGATPQTAQEFVDEFIARRPDSYAGFMGAGILLRAQSRPAEAVEAYERALELDQSRIEVHNNLLGAAGAAGRLDEQAERYRALVDADPYDPVLRFALGCVHIMQGDPDLALRELRESLRLGESTGLARLRLCAALVEKGKSVIEQGPRLDLERWSAAWGYFEECLTEVTEVRGSRAVSEAEALAAASDVLIDIAMTSNRANPPFVESIGDREIEVLTQAGRLLYDAGHADPQSKAVEARMNRLYGLVQSFGTDVLSSFLRGVAGRDR